MATIKEECTFTTGADQVRFITQTNGDKLLMKNLNLSQDQATSLSWLVNTERKRGLVWTVRLKGRS